MFLDCELIIEIILIQYILYEAVCKGGRKMNAFDYFGKTLVESVYDGAMYEWECFINIKSKTPSGKMMAKHLESFTEEHIDVLNELFPMIIDNTITHFLYMLENQKDIDLGVFFDGVHIERLQDEYYGLHLELDKWVSKYSKWVPKLKRYEEVH